MSTSLLVIPAPDAGSIHSRAMCLLMITVRRSVTATTVSIVSDL